MNLINLERVLQGEQKRGARMNDQLNAIMKHLLKKQTNPPQPRPKVVRSERPWREDPLELK